MAAAFDPATAAAAAAAAAVQAAEIDCYTLHRETVAAVLATNGNDESTPMCKRLRSAILAATAQDGGRDSAETLRQAIEYVLQSMALIEEAAEPLRNNYVIDVENPGRRQRRASGSEGGGAGRSPLPGAAAGGGGAKQRRRSSLKELVVDEGDEDGADASPGACTVW